MTKQYKNYVNGEWKLSKEEIKIYAPATGEELGSVPAMSQEEVDCQKKYDWFRFLRDYKDNS